MNRIVAVIERAERAGPLLDVATTYAEVIDGRLDVYSLPPADPSVRLEVRAGAGDLHVLGPDAGADALVEAVARAPADLVVLGATALDPGGWATDLLRHHRVPLLAVPQPVSHYVVAGPPRVLVPLDGPPGSATAVVDAIQLFAHPEAEVVVLHVFDEESAPRFWDQPAHAERSWGEEFLTRHGRRSDSRLELRSGSPRDEVLDAARAERADVIALGCAGDLSPGRARLVRHVLHHAEVPVLLVHADAPGGRLPGAGTGAR
jgi:nucleotide-binding universal stress UspA family protein